MEDLVCFLEFLARSQVGSKINETMKRSKFKQSIASCLKIEKLESFSQNPNCRDDEAMGLLFGKEYNRGEIFRGPLKQANTPGTAASPEPADRRDHPVEMQLECSPFAIGSSDEITTPVPCHLPGQLFP